MREGWGGLASRSFPHVLPPPSPPEKSLRGAREVFSVVIWGETRARKRVSFKVNDGGRSYAEAEAEAEAAVADARRTFGRRRRDKHTHMISQKRK